jgi:hypothetical protein
VEQAMVLKTTRITVETDTLMVVRRARSISAWCPDCRAEVDAIALGSDSLAEAATASQVQQWLDSGKLHYWQHADEPAQICVPSLLQSIESEGVRTCSSSHPNPLSQLRRKSMKLTRSIANLFRLSGFALALALIAIPIWAQQQVDVVNGKGHPVPVLDAAQPFEDACSLTFNGSDRASCTFKHIPPRKRLVIQEFDSVLFIEPGLQPIYITFITGYYHFFTSTFMGSSAGFGVSSFATHQETRLYVAPGIQPVCEYLVSENSNQAADCQISGYLVDVP